MDLKKYIGFTESFVIQKDFQHLEIESKEVRSMRYFKAIIQKINKKIQLLQY